MLMTSFIFNKTNFSNLSILFISIFYPSGEPISQHRLRCSPFAVVYYSFMGHFLVAAAISSR